jgi:putative flippase GtrA
MITLKYIVFGIIATLVNLCFQFFSFFIFSGQGSLYFAMFMGTLAGLLVKYILDKKYIFNFYPINITDDTKKFLLYSFMGIFTTLVFWGIEIMFNSLFQSYYAKYIGATIGLSIGYIFKYFLDKKYVFIHKKKTTL